MDTKDPLAPLDTVVSVTLALMGVFALIMVFAIAFGSGSVVGISRHNSEVCVEIQPGQGAPYGGAAGEGGTVMGLRSGVRSFPSSVNVCDSRPGAAEVTLQAVKVIPGLAGVVGFFVWLRLILRRMRRDGVFADRVPRAFAILGEALVAWALVTWVVDGFVNAALLHRMSSEATSVFLSPTFPITPLLVGIGLMTLGRVFGQAVLLRRDSEATI